MMSYWPPPVATSLVMAFRRSSSSMKMMLTLMSGCGLVELRQQLGHVLHLRVVDAGQGDGGDARFVAEVPEAGTAGDGSSVTRPAVAIRRQPGSGRCLVAVMRQVGLPWSLMSDAAQPHDWSEPVCDHNPSEYMPGLDRIDDRFGRECLPELGCCSSRAVFWLNGARGETAETLCRCYPPERQRAITEFLLTVHGRGQRRPDQRAARGRRRDRTA